MDLSRFHISLAQLVLLSDAHIMVRVHSNGASLEVLSQKLCLSPNCDVVDEHSEDRLPSGFRWLFPDPNTSG